MSRHVLDRRLAGSFAGLAVTAALGLVPTAALGLVPDAFAGSLAPYGGTGTPAIPAAGVCTAAPEEVRLQPTQNAPGGRGRMILTPAVSAYGIAVDAEGRHRYEVRLEIEVLRRREGASYVVWAATPELDRVARLGVLGDGNRIEGEVAWNKFLVFVSEEAVPDGERWAGPILLTGLSPSGRMHTMAGHGPFEGVACQDFY